MDIENQPKKDSQQPPDCEITSHSTSEQIENQSNDETQHIQMKKPKKRLPHPKSQHYKMHSYGFGGVRYDNIVMLSKEEALIPIGTSLARWNILKHRRLEVIQTNSDSIFVLLEIAGIIISISYSGQVTILQKEGLHIIGQFQTKGRVVRHASVSQDYLCISCEEFEDLKGQTEIYKLSEILAGLSSVNNEESNTSEGKTQQPPFVPSIYFSLQGRYRFGIVTKAGNLVTLYERQVQQSSVAQSATQPAEQSSKKSQKQKKQYYYDAYLFDLSSKKELANSSLPYVCDIISSSSNGDDIGSYLYLDRYYLILDLNNLQSLTYSKINGKGSINTSTFVDSNTLVLSPVANYLLLINCKALRENPLPRDFDPTKAGQYGNYEIKYLKSKAVHPDNYFFYMQNETIFSANEGGFVYQNINNPSNHSSYEGMSMTCCGLATNEYASIVAVGDFSGNVSIYPAEKCTENDPVFQTCIMSSIRSLEFNPTGDALVIGTMDGSIYKWFYEDFSQQPQLICTLKGSITGLSYKNSTHSTSQLLASTTEGQFGIFEDSPGQSTRTNILMYGHLPQDSSDRFGSLERFAEIWSCCWSCNDSHHIATSSEDQTVHIFDLTHRQPLQTFELKGHQLAVTSIDWKQMGGGLGEVFISCSDDQTIRVYDPRNQFELKEVVTTSFVKEWHTLTYLSLEVGGTRVAIGSQNGYFFIYDLLKHQFEYSEKIHMGGIEGLVWGKNRIFTCSSDCCVNVIEV